MTFFSVFLKLTSSGSKLKGTIFDRATSSSEQMEHTKVKGPRAPGVLILRVPRLLGAPNQDI